MVEGRVAGGWWLTGWCCWCCGWTESQTIYQVFLVPKCHTNFVMSAMMSLKTLGYFYKFLGSSSNHSQPWRSFSCYGCCLLPLQVWWHLDAYALTIAIAGGVEVRQSGPKRKTKTEHNKLKEIQPECKRKSTQPWNKERRNRETP